jgi:hypothetical protein
VKIEVLPILTFKHHFCSVLQENAPIFKLTVIMSHTTKTQGLNLLKHNIYYTHVKHSKVILQVVPHEKWHHFEQREHLSHSSSSSGSFGSP